MIAPQAAPIPQAAPAPKLSPRNLDFEQAYSPSNRSMQMKSAAPVYRAKKMPPAPTQQQQQQQKARPADKADALY
jgi:hypothetical protein